MRTTTSVLKINCIKVDCDSSRWIKNTSRKLFISGSFYPILFQSDEKFATTESSEDILKKFSSEKYPTINKVSILFEGFYVKFNEKGEIIQTP